MNYVLSFIIIPYIAMRKRVNEFRQLTKIFQEEVEILILEEESLRDELEVEVVILILSSFTRIVLHIRFITI